jgi:hypothetical protein
MANFLYNGVELPELPEWDKETYPYAALAVSMNGELPLGSILYCSTSPIEAVPRESTYWFCPREDSEYVCFIWDLIFNKDTEFGHETKGTCRTDEAFGFSDAVHWSNHDIYNRDDDSLYLAASNPIRLDSKLSISIGTSKALYNSVELPALPVVEGYPYAYIHYDAVNKPALMLFDKKCKAHHEYYDDRWHSSLSLYPDKGSEKLYRINEETEEWECYYTFHNSYGGYILPFWANTDIYHGASYDGHGNPYEGDSPYEEGTIFLAASEPVPVGDYNRATFTCSNLNTTDSVYKIAAWCYPKGTSYLDAPHTYTSADYFGGKNHSESWALPELSPGVEYELYACIFANDEATDHNALVTFTTDGVPELDFSNATLTVTNSTVDRTDFRFELDYTGLPYNADGTSAVFHIVGVTDAGDEAIMGWRATSGSGYVSGTFIGLEPLTDYTATFEVYYNGKPTGVTASVSFTSGEGFDVGGYDRDSFLLGFASGLGCTAATKTDAEYNSWAQGYIVGSALRKVL